jgi:LysM repeat protein
MGAYRHSSLRALAPAALILFAIAFLIVVVSSLGGSSNSSSSDAARSQPSKPQKRQSARKRPTNPVRTTPGGARFYTVRSGDNLSTIAAKTGVSVDQLLQLNPSLDPQGLVNGQRVRLPGRRAGATGASGASGVSGATGPG